ncbi:YdeI/OmpD-associated family protein [Intestinimonas butyriciproducens]|uniref:YdeI/OmpD-associated family protein n=1 Tax=Intestinimonas butyriciproducens TaxID=1297617 RepID=UPI00051C78E7|nr:YdeI/OmpD-associated family protein [Intestinimonas butyriciproducens]MDB7817912.1 YdeI/OmpD-associated family protein [Intestinimonas butyriciproducens]MDB7844803.1 YdeI/OmpD-associated family protein [Intestinimonas butyriciproducens]MDB7859167.1 YdeI/OmpD-associated family protein [Intestinimonas butyriciproducens]
MNETIKFANREEFRRWLHEHCLSNVGGIWLLFGKAGGPKTIKAGEALEEALCFGWIDGQMERIDDKTYKKYFSLRRKNSKWSEKNKALVKKLEERGLMTDFGREKIAEAKRNGQWDALNPLAIITEEQIARLSALLKGYEPAYTNFQAMSMSVKETYTRAYLDAKTEVGRKKRIAWMVDRLNKNLKPM